MNWNYEDNLSKDLTKKLLKYSNKIRNDDYKFRLRFEFEFDVTETDIHKFFINTIVSKAYKVVINIYSFNASVFLLWKLLS